MTVQHQMDFVKQLAVRYTRDQNEIDDLVQETMYKAIKKRHQFKEGTNLKAWLATILRNNFINQLRKRKRETHIGDQNDLSRMDKQTSEDTDQPMFLQEIHKQIDLLPDHLAQPLMLCMKGYPYEEIAQKFDVPLGTIKSRIFHARKRLRQQLNAPSMKRA